MLILSFLLVIPHPPGWSHFYTINNMQNTVFCPSWARRNRKINYFTATVDHLRLNTEDCISELQGQPGLAKTDPMSSARVHQLRPAISQLPPIPINKKVILILPKRVFCNCDNSGPACCLGPGWRTSARLSPCRPLFHIRQLFIYSSGCLSLSVCVSSSLPACHCQTCPPAQPPCDDG